MNEVRRRPGGRSARVRRAVLDATVELLERHGLDGLSVSEVAARAGVHETSIYRRWGTRDTLMIEAMLDAAGDHLPVPDTGSLREDLTTYATRLAAYLTTPLGNALDRAIAAASDAPEAGRTRTRFWDSRSELSQQMITRAVARGELPEGTDARFVIELLVAPLHFKVVLSREPIDPALPARIVDALLAGIAAQAPPRVGP
ncbi:TetR/AcrR family transcriptional regulator [Pseudonocardia sp.]|uniref:TetR/AcrR family transcriptional regulator n=1 Tax=Pseudonocardia sp. TaxID=60912 RepID=UPI003D0E99CE